MARKKQLKNKNGLAVYKLDFELLKSKRYLDKGEVLSLSGLGRETGYTRAILRQWQDEMPQAVSVLMFLVKEHGVTLEELLKPVYE